MSRAAKYASYYAVTDPDGRLRFETISLEHAQACVASIYHHTGRKGRSGMICSITQKPVKGANAVSH